MKKLKEILKNPVYYLIKLIGKCLPDNLSCNKFYLKILYRNKFKNKLDIEDPKTFNEKIQWLKLYDRNPEYTKMVDKYEVKKYVKNLIGEEYIIDTLGIYDTFDDIDFSKLPDKFVLKCTHDSGGVVVCKDKETIDVKKCRKKFKKLLRRNYFYNGREFPYKNVKPRIIVEPFMSDGINEDLLDYKFMCFNGKVKCSFVCSERRSEKGLAVDFFDNNWNHLPFERHYRNLGKEIKKPDNLEKMIALAEKLSKGTSFVRVDFYDINGNIYFGEMTFYPGSGLEEFNPEDWDYKLGELITIKRDDENEKDSIC